MFAAGLLAVASGLQNALAATARDFTPGQIAKIPPNPITHPGASDFAPGRFAESPGDPVIFAPGHAKNLEDGGGGGQGP